MSANVTFPGLDRTLCFIFPFPAVLPLQQESAADQQAFPFQTLVSMMKSLVSLKPSRHRPMMLADFVH